MNLCSEKIFAIYAKKGDGKCEELIIDIANRQYESNSYLDEKNLIREVEKGIREFRVSEGFLSMCYGMLEDSNYCGEETYLDMSYEARQELNRKYEEEERKKPVIPKSKIWQAVKFELEQDELDSILSFDYKYQADNYYNFEIIDKNIHAVMRGERSLRYFTSWCILLMRCFDDYHENCKSKRLSELYFDLSDYLDGVAFMDNDLEGEEKDFALREIWARLKYFNHLICNAKSRKQTDFTTNNVVTNLMFAFCLEDDDTVYQACIVDKERKRINFMYIPESEIGYLEEINYSFLNAAEFDGLPNTDYTFDKTLPIDYAIKR